MTTTSVAVDPMKAWFPAYKVANGGKPRLRILCFPNAGSAENIYSGPSLRNKQRMPNKLSEWASEAKAEVMAVQMPGREQRRNEPFIPTCQAMAEALLPVIEDKIKDESIPYVIVAHSCGNWVAYELLRLIRSGGLPLPKVFFVSCMASPDIADTAKPWRPNKEMSVAELQEECKLWDINQVVFRADVWPNFEPLLRADFSLFDQYKHAEEPMEPFDFPIHAFFASDDRKISRAMVEGWRSFTTCEFGVEQIRGNHLFVYDVDARDSWFETIADILTGEGF